MNHFQMSCELVIVNRHYLFPVSLSPLAIDIYRCLSIVINRKMHAPLFSLFFFPYLKRPPAAVKFIHASFRGQGSTRSKTEILCYWSIHMASRSRLCVYLFLGALFPTFANCIRPFRVPTNLFVQGTSPHTLPEGIREIRRDVREPEEGIRGEDAETFEGLHNRFRRSTAPNSTIVSFCLSF